MPEERIEYAEYEEPMYKAAVEWALSNNSEKRYPLWIYINDLLLTFATDYLGTPSEIIDEDESWEKGSKRIAWTATSVVAREAMDEDPERSGLPSNEYINLDELSQDMARCYGKADLETFVNELLVTMAEGYCNADPEIYADDDWEAAVDVICEQIRDMALDHIENII